jgi:hypothetical protein
MGLLHRLGYDLALGNSQSRTFIFEIFLGPDLGKDPQGFLPLRTSIVGIDFETGKFRFRDRAPATELDSPVGQHIQGGDAFGHPQGMVDAKGQQHDAVSEADVFGPGGQMGKYQFRRGAVRKSGQKVMLGEPDCTVAELVGEHRLLDTLIERALHAGFRQIRGFEFEKQTQFHRRASQWAIFAANYGLTQKNQFDGSERRIVLKNSFGIVGL